jgi:hypothetical protein
MTSRWWSACLGAVSLLGILGVLSFAGAKPPDLPLEEKITVTDVVVEIYDGCVQISLPHPPKPADIAGMTIFPMATTIQPNIWEKLPPSGRRVLATSLLFGIHPLLSLIRTEEMVDLPGDHPIHFGTMDWDSAAPEPQKNTPVEPEPSPKIWQEGPPGTTHEQPTTCPWMRQQAEERTTTRPIEIDWTTDDVQGNLQKLNKADHLVEQGTRHLARGEYREALDCLLQAVQLCPGSRVEGKAVNALTKTVAKMLEDKGGPKGDASEESEMPVECHPCEAEPLCAEIEVGPDGVRMHCQFRAAGYVHEVKYNRGSFTWSVRAK